VTRREPVRATSPLVALVLLLAVLIGLSVAAACGGNRAPVASSVPPPPGPAAFPGATTAPPRQPGQPPTPPAVSSDSGASSTSLPWDTQPLDVINGPDSPLKPVFFALDSDSLDDTARKVLNANAEVLKTYRTWVITVEGHCDERGTAEYNLALGDRRALAAKNYLISLGIPGDRIRTVSYGNEFPFDPGHVESAWIKNRRAHSMLTSK
jgi:peptidoglycan-associated lipoprotein